MARLSTHLIFVAFAAIALSLASSAALAQPDDSRNLLPNPSFELVDDQGNPIGWHFHDARAGAKMTVDETVAHTGKRSVKLTNPHPLQPHVYGTFWCRVKVRPGHWYTLSLYARSLKPGRAWFGCGPKWERRKAITATGGKWQRFTLTFKTYDNERYLEPRINVDSQTDGLWIDSVQLEEGKEPTKFVMPPLLEPAQCVLKIQPARVGENLIKNGSFERWRGKWPEHWRWDKRNTNATMTRDETRARSGRYSVKITNGTPFGPHVYGQLLYAERLKVKPNTTYTVSAWIWSEAPGVFWIGGFDHWRARAYAPRGGTGGKWRRIWVTYTTGPNETEARVMINTDSPTKGVWIDDYKVEEGDEPTPFVLEGQPDRPRIEAELQGRTGYGQQVNPWMPDRYPPSHFVFGEQLWAVGHILYAAGRKLTVTVSRDGQVIERREAAVPNAKCARFEFGKYLDRGGKIRVELALADGSARAAYDVTVITRADIDRALVDLRPLVDRLRAKVNALGLRGHYPRVTLTIAQHFLDWIAEDARHAELARAWAELQTTREIVRAALARENWPQAPKFVTSRVQIDGPSFIGDVRWPDGRRQRRPVIFVGQGPFGQARRDADILPDYGFNIMQVEFGPRSVVVDEGKFSDEAINEFLEVCDRAAKAGVQVNLLISPHYFPNWALRKWPHLNECSGGFFRYCVHAPEAREVLRQFIRYTIPRIKDHPALHSICLSNEPISTNIQRCRFVRADWHRWLQRKYGTVARLNELWGSNYASFDEIPVPPAQLKPDPLVCDFVRFNQEEFAAFHKFMADEIQRIAPELPVHAKMMICAVFGRSSHGVWSIAPELFAQFCQINGNDAWRIYSPHGEWATAWQDEIMGYELQRCAREAPVFNSEDHIIPDRNINWQSPTYIYNVFWQGAVHGRGASSTWVWERTYDLTSSFCGSILHRPACIQAQGWCCLDLNRLAEEVTALQRVKPRVAVLYSYTGYVWDANYDDIMEAAWRASVFAGHKTGFVYERQLEALAEGRPLPEYISEVRALIVAGLNHLSAKAMRGLETFARSGGKIIAIGPLPDRDEYGRPAKLDVRPAAMLRPDEDRELMAQLDAALKRCGVQAPAKLLLEDGSPAYGIDYWAARHRGRWLVNISNYRREEPRVQLVVNGQRVAQARDLISGQTVRFPAAIPSLRPLLLRLK